MKKKRKKRNSYIRGNYIKCEAKNDKFPAEGIIIGKMGIGDRIDILVYNDGWADACCFTSYFDKVTTGGLEDVLIWLIEKGISKDDLDKKLAEYHYNFRFRKPRKLLKRDCC
jgi:hypothetical protein